MADQPLTFAEWLVIGRHVLANSPFSVLMGTELLDNDAQIILMRQPITPQVKQQFGYVHGGVMAYLADNAMSFAGGLALGEKVLMSEFKINLIRPGKGEYLLARASLIAATGRQATCRCDIFGVTDATDTLCATALGTIVSFG